MTPYQMGKREQQLINQVEKDCRDIRDDLERAKQAGVPNIEALEAALSTCEERAALLRSVYMKGKK